MGYAHRPDQIRWTPGALAAVRRVNEAGLFAFVATNQAGVARGYYGVEQVESLHRWMNAELAKGGAHIDAFELSPFHPDGVVAEYARASDCRKPNPGMLIRLLRDWPVDPARTLMIGDKPSDVEAAESAGVRGLLLTSSDQLETKVADWIAALAPTG